MSVRPIGSVPDHVRKSATAMGFGELRRMVQFAATYPDEPIVVTLSRQLSWSHFLALLPLKDPLQRDYYAQMASAERWSVRTLRGRIDSMLYERTALSQKPEETIAQELAILRDAQRMTPALVMRDPYILDFLGLRDSWQESDLEAAVIREMESFLLELGAGFSVVARQKRIPIDDEDFHLDLLFYNRKLRRLVAVECPRAHGWRTRVRDRRPHRSQHARAVGRSGRSDGRAPGTASHAGRRRSASGRSGS